MPAGEFTPIPLASRAAGVRLYDPGLTSGETNYDDWIKHNLDYLKQELDDIPEPPDTYTSSSVDAVLRWSH